MWQRLLSSMVFNESMRYGLNAKTFGNWLRVYRHGQKGDQPVSLIPVTIRTAAPVAGCLRLCCLGKHVLEIPADIAPQWLAELLRCLD